MHDIEKYLIEIAEGSMDALHHLYKEMRTPIYALLISIVKSRSIAEDLLQDTFIMVYNKASKYTAQTQARAWIYRIARNLAYDNLRRSKHTIYLESEESLAGSPSTKDDPQEKLDLMATLLKLGELDRQIVVLYVISGFKHAEIAELLEMPCSTVRWKYRRALSQMASMLGGDQGEHTQLLHRSSRSKK